MNNLLSHLRKGAFLMVSSKVLVALCACLILIVSESYGFKKTLHISGSETNDLVQIIRKQNKIKVSLYSSAGEALKNARTGDGLLILADHYPVKRVDLGNDFFDLLSKKNIKAYIEFPVQFPGIKFEKVEKAKAERAVVKSTFFHGLPDTLCILGINGLHYIRTTSGVDKEHIVAAKVAGFDSAIYGLPEKQIPLLFEPSGYPVLISTTNLSRFVSGRYAPAKEWEAVWIRILEYVVPGSKIRELKWEPVMAPSYTKGENLPRDYQLKSLSRGIEWYKNARMLIPGSYKDTLIKMHASKLQRLPWSSSIPAGDGTNGVFECIFSEIDEKGSQPIGIMERGDCVSETSMAYAIAGRALKNEEYKTIARNLLDYYLMNSIATKNEYADPNHGAYGLIPWGISSDLWFKQSYGDDNARFLLAAWTTAALTGIDHWDEIMMKSLLALVRTTGKNGFRGSRLDLPNLGSKGWKHYYNQESTNLAPHFECYLWACYLWAYDKTGDPIFLDRAQNGIKIMMASYPNGWRWTNGLSQEKARMILPLAWLVRVKDNAENREMLMRVVNDLLKLQDKSGAIREELGDIKMGKYPPPLSNEAYGTNEASLIAKNGDPVSDLLYTTNFAFLGLHEAAFATKDKRIKAAVDKMAEFLSRIQVKSKGHPELDGGWMRSFDYQRYEHWGSNADHGWGAWAIETGWTQGWIAGIMGLRELNQSIWDLTKESKIARYHPKLKEKMLPEN